MDFLNLITFIYQSVWLSQSPFNKSCTNYNHWKNIKAIDNAGIICGVFLDQQEAFDTVDHEILSKLEHFICGVPLKWFKTFLTQWHQYVSIKNSISETLFNDHGVPQGSVLGPLLFLIYINDLHQVTKHAEIHFVDDTNLLYSSKSLKDINQKINFELKNIVHWLRANKISLNTKKTEIVLFRAHKTIIKKNMNFQISGQKVNIIYERNKIFRDGNGWISDLQKSYGYCETKTN